MEFKGEWRIDDTGLAHWDQRLVITDEKLKAAYRQNCLIEYIIETSAFKGVAVGMA